eukprot:3896293-Pyramimonas_sp.AAC.1
MPSPYASTVCLGLTPLPDALALRLSLMPSPYASTVCLRLTPLPADALVALRLFYSMPSPYASSP